MWKVHQRALPEGLTETSADAVRIKKESPEHHPGVTFKIFILRM